MEEQIIIASTKTNLKKIVTTITVILVLILAAPLLYFFVERLGRVPLTFRHGVIWGSIRGSLFQAWRGYINNDLHLSVGIPVFICLPLVWVVYYWSRIPHLVVTNKRVYGSTTLGERLDLPVDSISSVGKGVNVITITTASRVVRFDMIANYAEVHHAISELLVKRQEAHAPTQPVVKQDVPQSNADELRKYKELLNDGIISQEEFDAKKKQLLGL